MKNLKLALCLLGTTLPIAAPTLAADADTTNRDFSGFYLGAGFGQSFFSDDGLSSDMADNSGIQGIDLDTDDSNYLIYGGYYFNRVIGIEVNYIDYGDVEASAKGLPTETITSVKSTSLSANIGYTFNNGIRIFALPGLAYVDSDMTDDNVGIHYGAGIEYTPSAVPHLTVRTVYQGDFYFSEKDDNFNDGDPYAFSSSTLAIGAAYRF